MFDDFLKVIIGSFKLDKNLYKDPKTFGENALYFAGLIMLLDGIAGAVALKTIYNTNIIYSGITSLISWIIWGALIFVIGLKVFPEASTNSNFRAILITVGIAHAPGLLRFFAIDPILVIPIVFITQFWMYVSPVVYPISIIPEKWRYAFSFNPMVGIIETARQIIFGTSSIEPIYIINGLISTAIMLFFGLLIFNRVEKTFLDTI